MDRINRTEEAEDIMECGNEKCTDSEVYPRDALFGGGFICVNCGWVKEEVTPPKLPNSSGSTKTADCAHKLAEIDSLIRNTHTDMSGKHKYHIPKKNHDRIGQLVKEMIWDLNSA